MAIAEAGGIMFLGFLSVFKYPALLLQSGGLESGGAHTPGTTLPLWPPPTLKL